MGILNRLLRKKDTAILEDPRIGQIVRKLVSPDDTAFGEGLTEVLAIPEGDPSRLLAIRQAISLRSGKCEISFYEPDIDGLTARPGLEMLDARERILSLAERKALLDDPHISGNLMSAFLTLHGFEGVVELAREVEDIGGLGQFQAYQLVYNQNRASVVLRKSQKGALWQCPQCGSTLEKHGGGAAAVLKAGGELMGTVTCGQCGAKYSLGEIYGGKYDV